MLRQKYNFDDESELRHEQLQANNSHACIEPDLSYAQLASEVSEKYQDAQGSQIYKQKIENPSTLPTHNSKYSESVEKQLEEPHQQKNYSNLYHLEGAGEVRPNLLMGNGTSSPVPQSNEVFTMKPHQPQPEYDPYKKNTRNQQLKKAQNHKASNKDTQKEPEAQQRASRRRSRRPPSTTSNRKSNNVLPIHDSSTVALAKAEKQAKVISQQVAQESTQNLFNTMSYTNIFELVRDCTFGANYIHPNFTIKTRDGSSLISAKKQYCHFNSYYSITAGTKELGCLKGNFGGSEFNLYRFTERSEELVATIAYKTNLSCSSDFRRMQVFIKNEERNDLVFDAEAKRKSLQQLHEEGYTDNICVIRTKQPTWNQKQQCYTMSFGGKGKLPSIKNMILVSSSPQPSLLFCKSSKNTFHMQLSNLLSLFVSMGILMSSFDFKLFCQ